MASLLRLRPYVRPYLWLIVVALVLAIPLAGIRASPALLVKRLVDDLLVNKDASQLVWFTGTFIGIFALNFIVRFLHTYSLRVVVARVNQRVKNELYEHVMGLSADYFTQTSTGQLMSRVGADTNYIDQGLASINVVVREPVSFALLFGYACSLNWRLTLITLIVFPPLAMIFRYSGKKLKKYIQQMQEENARLFATLQESFSGIRVIKTFRLESYIRNRFLGQSGSYTRVWLKTALLEEISHPLVEFITAIAVAGVIYYGGTLVLTGKMTSGDLIGFFTAFAMMTNPLRQLNDISIKLHTASGAAARVFEVFDWKSNLLEKPNAKVVSDFQNSVRLEGVRFAYPDAPEREVLRGISFEVKKGHAVALVGASGAGKSSLVSLLPRIYDVTAGRILIDDQDIRDLSIDSLRKSIAVVTQDVFLFNDTIEENIRCGRLGATQEEVEWAARKAHAWEFISRAPDGLKTVIGDRGQKLSGGERQRLSIARAFLRQSPILILDEATSALDAESERMVQQALDELMRDRTTIVIAHRLSTIRHCDQILVMKEGQVIESGSHDTLLAKKGEYARFHFLAETQGLSS